MAQEQARRAEEPHHQVDPPPQEGDRPESSLKALALRIQGRVFNMDAAARAALRARVGQMASAPQWLRVETTLGDGWLAAYAERAEEVGIDAHMGIHDATSPGDHPETHPTPPALDHTVAVVLPQGMASDALNNALQTTMGSGYGPLPLGVQGAQFMRCRARVAEALVEGILVAGEWVTGTRIQGPGKGQEGKGDRSSGEGKEPRGEKAGS